MALSVSQVNALATQYGIPLSSSDATRIAQESANGRPDSDITAGFQWRAAHPTAPTGGTAATAVYDKPAQSSVSLPGLTSDQSAALTGPEQNAYEAVYSTLGQYGLTSLASVIYGYVTQGFDASTINYLIQQTPQWKQRFAGNEVLKQKGLAPLDPATYLSVEQSYAQALQQAGVPAGMYGQGDFASWIGNSVSPSEIQQRAQVAGQWVNDTDPAFRAALLQFHGIDQGHLVGYALDTSRGLPYLQMVSQQAQIGAAAIRQHLAANPDFAMQLANMGVTQQQAEQGYSEIAQTLPRLQELGQIANKPFTQQTAEQATFLGEQAAKQQQLNIVQQEQTRFQGQAGLGSNYFHPAYGVSRDLEGAF